MSSPKIYTLATTLVVLLAAAAAQAGDVYLGITMSPITSSMARALQLDEDEGVLIDEVIADSPADAAGLESGDIIVAIEGRAIHGSKGLAKEIHRYEPDDEVTITVVRSGDRRDLQATLGKKKRSSFTVWSDDDGDKKVWSWAPGADDEDSVFHEGKVFEFHGDGDDKLIIQSFGMGGDRGFLGIVPRSIESDEVEDLGLGNDRGVVIAELVDDGPADQAGLREGDVIVALDDEAIDDGDELHDFLADTEAGETVSVRVVRDGDKREYDVELGETPSQVKLADIIAPRHRSQPQFYSGTIAPQADLEKLEKERQEIKKMRSELEELKGELQALREELEKKK